MDTPERRRLVVEQPPRPFAPLAGFSSRARRRLGIPLALTLAALLPAWVAAAEPGAVVAKIGDRPALTAERFVAEMGRRARGRPGAFDSVDERRALAEELVLRQLRIEAALVRGLADDPEVVAAFEGALLRRLDETTLADVERPVSDADLRSAFEAERARWSRPERRRAAVIRLPRPEDETAREELRALRERFAALAPGDPELARLVARTSTDRATAFATGDSGWLARGERYRWPAALVDALFALDETGGVTPAVEEGDSVWLARLVAVEPAGGPDLAEVAPVLGREIATARRRESLAARDAALLAGADVAIDEALLRELVLPDPQPPPLPGSVAEDPP